MGIYKQKAPNINIKLHRTHILIIAVYVSTDASALEIKDEFEANLTDMILKIGYRKGIMLMGDFNGPIRSKQSDVIGQYGEKTTHYNGIRLAEICESYNLQILNGFYQHKNIYKYTWHKPTRKLKCIDCVIIKQMSTLKVNDVQVYWGAECGSDHFLLKTNIYFNKIERSTQTESESTT